MIISEDGRISRFSGFSIRFALRLQRFLFFLFAIKPPPFAAWNVGPTLELHRFVA